MSGLFGAASSAASASNPTQGNLSKDVVVANPPDDSISEIRFCPQAEFLSVASWDKKVRIYEIDGSGQSQGKALFEHEGPVLSTCWSPDGTKVFGGGADKAGRMLDLGSGSDQAQQVAAHDQPIRVVRSFTANNSPMLVTGSWDRTVKYWDLRQQQPAATLDAKERVYSMDTDKDSMLVIGTADRQIHVVDLRNPSAFFKSLQSPLKWQTRTVTTFTKSEPGYAIGSIEGRCAIQYVDDKESSKNFSFKCHRQTPPTDRNISNVYSVNAISFHPEFGTFSTAGSDGTFHFWDKDAKHRLKGYPEVGGTITSTDFNRTGNIFAYAVSYDWSKGYNFHQQGATNKIMLHPVQDDECKPRPKTQKR